jgi:hypothetical protein
LGVDGVFCNDPGRARAELKHFQTRSADQEVLR